MERYPEPNMNEYAGMLDRRAEAVMVDALLVVVVVGTLGYLIGEIFMSGPYGGQFLAMIVLQFFGPFLLVGYQAGFEGYYGQTIGKWSRGIVVVNEDGSSISWGSAILRNFLRFIDSLPAFYVVGLVIGYATDGHQRIGDLAGSTVVVYTQE